MKIEEMQPDQLLEGTYSADGGVLCGVGEPLKAFATGTDSRGREWALVENGWGLTAMRPVEQLRPYLGDAPFEPFKPGAGS